MPPLDSVHDDVVVAKKIHPNQDKVCEEPLLGLTWSPKIKDLPVLPSSFLLHSFSFLLQWFMQSINVSPSWLYNSIASNWIGCVVKHEECLINHHRSFPSQTRKKHGNGMSSCRQYCYFSTQTATVTVSWSWIKFSLKNVTIQVEDDGTGNLMMKSNSNIEGMKTHKSRNMTMISLNWFSSCLKNVFTNGKGFYDWITRRRLK